jgi:hypothetical protein
MDDLVTDREQRLNEGCEVVVGRHVHIESPPEFNPQAFE